jgi:hypothetical protein
MGDQDLRQTRADFALRDSRSSLFAIKFIFILILDLKTGLLESNFINPHNLLL